MSMSTSVVGFKPPDEKWRKMKDAWDACEAAGIEIPDEISEFFDNEPPDDSGVEIGLAALEKCGALSVYEDDSRQGFEIEVKKLPPDVTVLRFFNSW